MNPPRTGLTMVSALLLVALLATGCGLEPQTTPRAADNWSNGQMVGLGSLNNQVAFQLDEWGNGFLAWVDTDRALRLAHLDERATVVFEEPLDLPTNRPGKPQLLLDPTGLLHLSWIDRAEAGSQLFYARLTAAGEPIGERVAISPGEIRVGQHAMVLDPAGETIEFFWSDNVPSRPGVYHAAIDWSGAPVSPPQLMIEDGLLPSAQIDGMGYLHLAWRIQSQDERAEFYYAVYDPQRRTLGRTFLVMQPIAQMALLGGPTAGVSFDGPWLGLDQTHVYLAWTLEVRERGMVQDFTFYQAFRPPELAVRDLTEPFSYPHMVITAETVHIQGVDPSLTGQPAFLAGQPPRQYVSCFTQVAGRGNLETLQIAVVRPAPRLVEGQQVVTASPGASVRPSIAMDGQGYLYVAWIDTAGFERYQVLYAGNSPRVKEALNRMTSYDVVDRILSAVMAGFSALIFLPVVLLWVFVPIAYLAVHATVSSEVDLSTARGRRALVVAAILQGVSKLFFSAGVLDRFPLTYLFAPGVAELLGRWIVPVLLTGLAGVGSWLYVKRTENHSLFVAYFILAGIDIGLMMVLYAVVPLI